MAPIYIWKEYDWPYIPTNDTILYLPFTEDFNDYSGNNRTVVSVSSAEIKDGYYYNVSTSDDGGLNITDMPEISGNFTICYWVKKTQNPGSTQAMFCQANGTTGSNHQLHLVDYVTYFRFGFWGGDLDASLPDNGADTRRMFTCTYDGNNRIVYLNGSQIGASSRSGFSAGAGTGNFGCYFGSSWQSQGYVSHFIIEGTTWSANDILAYYNDTKTYFE